MSTVLNVNTITSISSYTSSFQSITATGGTTSNVTINNIDYRIHTFTSNGNFTVSSVGSNPRVDYLIVAGGGGGGMDMGGGGGGGGVLAGTFDVTGGVTYTVQVGAGGWGAPGGSQFRGDGVGPQPGAHQFTIPATNGSHSSVKGFDINLFAVGGGAGGSSYYPYTPGPSGGPGGSGGGASGYSDGGTRFGGNATAGQGFAGGTGGGQYYSGGGGGAGGPGIGSGATGMNATGGPGIRNDILGIPYYWAGGGGGAAYSYGVGGDGGIGGGGGGAVGTTFGGIGYNNGNAGGGGSPGSQTNTRGGNAAPNTGGGGGGGSHYNATNPGGNGGSGIVIIRYPLIDTSPSVTATSGTFFASPGSVIQTVYRRTDARFTYSSDSSGSGTPIGELGITITPKKSNSLLVMKWMINGEFYQDNVFVLFEDSALIEQPGSQGYNNTQPNVINNGIMAARYDQDENSTMSNWFLFFTVPANSTNARTYYPAIRGTSTHTFALNRTIGRSGEDAYENAVSAGYIMEIAQ